MAKFHQADGLHLGADGYREAVRVRGAVVQLRPSWRCRDAALAHGSGVVGVLLFTGGAAAGLVVVVALVRVCMCLVLWPEDRRFG